MKERITYVDWKAVETDKQNAVYGYMHRARREAEFVAQGQQPAVLIAGAPGMGKSKVIKDVIEKMPGVTPVLENPSNYKELLEVLTGSAGKHPVVFDEADTMLRTDKNLNILKAAFEPDAINRVYKGVSVNAKIFITTNETFDDYDKKLKLHFQALWNRVSPITIAGDPLTLWEYSMYVAQTTSLLNLTINGERISVANRQAAIDFFTYNVWQLKCVSVRTLQSLARDHHLFRADSTGFASRLADYIDPTKPNGVRPLTPELVWKEKV